MNDQYSEMTIGSHDLIGEQIKHRFEALLAEKAAIMARMPVIDAELRDCVAAGRLFGVQCAIPTTKTVKTGGRRNGGGAAKVLACLRQTAGLTYKELAAKTGITANGVSARLTYLKQCGTVELRDGKWFAAEPVVREAAGKANP